MGCKSSNASVTRQYAECILRMTANAWTPFSLARESAKYMGPGGRILLLSSGSSKAAQGDPFIAYGASKAAMDSVSRPNPHLLPSPNTFSSQVTRNLAAIYGITKKDVTVNSISIGPIETDALKASLKKMGPEFETFLNNWTLLKRIGQPQELADIVAFMAGPGSSFMMGNAIPANGGGLAALQG